MLFRTWFCPMPTSPGTKMIDGLVSPQDPHSFANHRQLLHTNTRQDKISSLSTYVQENTNQITGLSMIKTNCEVAPRICGHELKHCACRARNNCALSETIGATLKKKCNLTSQLCTLPITTLSALQALQANGEGSGALGTQRQKQAQKPPI